MSDGMEITFQGMTEFEGTMNELSIVVPEKICRRAMREAGRVVQAAVTEAAPVRPALPSGTALPPGALKADIELHVAKERDGSISAYIEPGKYTIYAARLVEYGHEMIVGGRKNKGGVSKGQVPPHPFFRPAYEESVDAAMTAAEETLGAEIQKEAERLGLVSR